MTVVDPDCCTRIEQQTHHDNADRGDCTCARNRSAVDDVRVRLGLKTRTSQLYHTACCRARRRALTWGSIERAIHVIHGRAKVRTSNLR